MIDRPRFKGPTAFVGGAVVGGLATFGVMEATGNSNLVNFTYVGNREAFQEGVDFSKGVDLYLSEMERVREIEIDTAGLSKTATGPWIEHRKSWAAFGIPLAARVDKRLTFSKDATKAKVGGVNFDLTKEYDRLFVDAFVDYTLHAYASDDRTSSGQDEKQYYSKGANSLIEFAKLGIDIEVEDDTFILLKGGQFWNLSAYYNLMHELGHPLPEKISFVDSKDGQVFPSYKDGEIVLTNKSTNSAFILYDGFFQAEKNTDLGLEKYKSIVVQAERDSEGMAGDLGDSRFSPSNAISDDFAISRYNFFINGQFIRSEIRNLRVQNPRAAFVLERKYAVHQEAFGKSFGEYGEEFKPTVGEVYSVENFDKENPEIPLRNEANLTAGETVGVIYNGYPVEIIEGPVEVVDIQGFTRKMYKVTYFDARTMVLGQPGWISDEWFLERVR